MLNNLLSKRLFICIFVLLICGVVSVYFLRTDLPEEPIKIYTPVEPTPKPKAEAPVRETEQDGHFHADGTWHEGAHDAHAPPAVPGTAPPGAVTTPDFPPVDPNDDPVEAAYKRLEYIKNNPYAWGGVHSERATELLTELMPPPVLIDHDHGDEVTALIDELCEQGDPRAAEALIAIMSDGGIMGQIMFDTLEAIGPPAVPYVLPYLFREETYGEKLIYIGLPVFDALSRVGVKYRADLGGILDHIIIPKIEEIAADGDNEVYQRASVIYAGDALARLGR